TGDESAYTSRPESLAGPLQKAALSDLAARYSHAVLSVNQFFPIELHARCIVVQKWLPIEFFGSAAESEFRGRTRGVRPALLGRTSKTREDPPWTSRSSP